MNHFAKHYTIGEARALLPEVRRWLGRLSELRGGLAELETHLRGPLAQGHDLGGETVNLWVRTLAELKEVLEEFRRREIQIKDVERGLVDFPAIMEGREIFLCWEQSEDDIGFWHDLDTGYAGREPL